MRPRQDGRHFPDKAFKCIFLNENVWISIEISLKFVPGGPNNNFPALVQIMAWRRTGDKPLSEQMRVSLPTHICVTRPQWVNSVENTNHDIKWKNTQIDICLSPLMIKYFNSLGLGDAYVRHWTGSSLVHVMACRLFGAKPVFESMMSYSPMDPWEQSPENFFFEIENFPLTKMHFKTSWVKVLTILSRPQYNRVWQIWCILIMISIHIFYMNYLNVPSILYIANWIKKTYSCCSWQIWKSWNAP